MKMYRCRELLLNVYQFLNLLFSSVPLQVSIHRRFIAMERLLQVLIPFNKWLTTKYKYCHADGFTQLTVLNTYSQWLSISSRRGNDLKMYLIVG